MVSSLKTIIYENYLPVAKNKMVRGMWNITILLQLHETCEEKLRYKIKNIPPLKPIGNQQYLISLKYWTMLIPMVFVSQVTTTNLEILFCRDFYLKYQKNISVFHNNGLLNESRVWCNVWSDFDRIEYFDTIIQTGWSMR